MAQKLQFPEQVKDWLVRRYNNQHRAWLEGDGEWPLTVPLGIPTESDAAANLSGVRGWVDAWSSWSGVGRLLTQERKWTRLGSQTLPATLALADPSEVAVWCGQGGRWSRARSRLELLRRRWPQLQNRIGLGKYFDVLADYSNADFERLMAVLSWALENPDSGLYVRQLPVFGVDTKWFEKRTSLVAELLGLLRGDKNIGDIYMAMGLRRPPHRVRMRVLCPTLRATVGGLRDIEAPLDELATLALRPNGLVVVENRETGIALPDMPGVVSFMGLGKAVSALGMLPWAKGVPSVYWGDIDTHGLAILSLARTTLPGLKSTLMDIETLIQFMDLAGQEPAQSSDAGVDELTGPERVLFDGLRAGTWGTKPRLEQERIPWEVAISTVISALSDVCLGQQASSGIMGDATLSQGR